MYFKLALDDLASSTKIAYLPAFIGFLEWGGWDTESLYKEHLKNYKADDPRAIKGIPLQVSQYQKHLMNEGKSSATAKTVEKAVKKFFKVNELPFEITVGKVKIVTEEIPNVTKDQLSRILNATGSYKAKAFITFAKDSGLRLGDITRLPIKKVRAAIEDPAIEYYTFEWKTRKTGRVSNPVIGPETLAALRTWMDYRINVLKLSAEDGDPLFCTERSRGAFTRRGVDIKETVKGDYMDDSSMGVTFSRLVRKARLERDIDGKLPSIHSCRKYHKTNLEFGGCPTSWVNKMQGRKGSGTGGAYTKPDSRQLIAIYSKAYSALGIYERVVSRDEMHIQNIEGDLWKMGIRGDRLESIMSEVRAAPTREGKYAILAKVKSPEPEYEYESADSKEELIEMMNEGWEHHKDTENGTVIIKRRLK